MVNTLENDRIPKQLIGRDILFFDGDCLLCHNLVKIILKVDEDKHFLLCSQQSDIGHLVLERHGIKVDDLSTIYVVRNCGSELEQILSRSQATLYVFSQTRSYAFAARLLSLIPRPILDFGYKCVAATRYRIFGKTDQSCRLPTAEEQQRIIG